MVCRHTRCTGCITTFILKPVRSRSANAAIQLAHYCLVQLVRLVRRHAGARFSVPDRLEITGSTRCTRWCTGAINRCERAEAPIVRPRHPVGGDRRPQNRRRAGHSSSAVPMRLRAAIPEFISGIVRCFSECSPALVMKQCGVPMKKLNTNIMLCRRGPSSWVVDWFDPATRVRREAFFDTRAEASVCMAAILREVRL